MPTKPFYLKLQYHRCSQTTDLYKHTPNLIFGYPTDAFTLKYTPAHSHT